MDRDGRRRILGGLAQPCNKKGDCPFRSGEIPGYLAKREGQSPFLLPFSLQGRLALQTDGPIFRENIMLAPRRSGLSMVSVLALLGLLILLLAMFFPALTQLRRVAKRSESFNNIR